MPEHSESAGKELSSEELRGEEVIQLPNREAMSLISGLSSPVPVDGADSFPAVTDTSSTPTASDPSAGPVATATDAANSTTSSTPSVGSLPESDQPVVTSEDNSLQSSSTTTQTAGGQ